MAGRRAAAGLALAVLALTAAGCGLGGSTKTVTTTQTRTVTTTRTVTRQSGPATPCTAVQLSGTFAAVAGSAGAGQVVYLLTLKNTSPSRCYVFGLPQAQLLSSTGANLPTHIVAAGSGSSGKQVVLAPGDSAVTQGRFSPSVAGQGDAQSGPCQPKASTLQVTPDGGGAVNAPVQPPTSVCERGTIYFDDFAAAT
ncbi:MAG TPA: DUF4232 domain-containing protein [Gaiellaceae bacterium]|nr:DUF4232 domain-containing protein [Gaiellaceae bacterium]